jgi:DNA-binding transcriptional MocR family regulator
VSLLLTPDQASAEALISALRASVQMPAFLMVALVTRWLQDGSGDAIIDAIPNEAPARQKLVPNVLVQVAYSRHPNGHHIWVPLPRNGGKTEFASHVQRQGLAIDTAESFGVGESRPNAIRVSPAPRAAALNWSERWRSSRLH